MKIFKYNFSKLILTLIYVGLVLPVIGLGSTIWQMVNHGIHESLNPTYTILQYALMIFLSVALAVMLISLLLSSYYKVEGTTFSTHFGVIVSKYDISQIERITDDKQNKKFVVTFMDNSFTYIVVKDEWKADLVDALRAVNSNIEFDVITEEKPQK